MANQKPDELLIPFTPADGEHGVLTVITQPRKLYMHQLTSEEIDTLCAAGNYKTLDVSLFSVCIGVLVAMWTVLATIPSDSVTPNVYASFTAALYVSLLGGVFFLIRAVLSWVRSNRTIKALKGEQ